MNRNILIKMIYKIYKSNGLIFLNLRINFNIWLKCFIFLFNSNANVEGNLYKFKNMKI